MEHDGCKLCKYEHVSEIGTHCQGCKQNAVDKYIRMTNADRIRSMSDEELAEFIKGLSEHCLAGIGACDCSGVNMQPCYEACGKMARKWIQSEVEE